MFCGMTGLLNKAHIQLASGMLWSTVGAVVSRLVNFALMIWVARELGSGRFGQLGAVQSSVGLFGLFAGAALGNAATRFVAKSVNAAPQDTHGYLSLIRRFSFTVIALTTTALLGSASFIGTVIFRNESIASALLVAAALMAATALKGVQMGVLAGFGRFRAIATVNVVEAILAMPLVFVSAREAGVNGVIGGLTVAAAVAYSLALLLGRGDLAAAKQVSHGVLSGNKTKDVISYTVPTFLGDLLATPTLWFCVALLARSEHGLVALGQYNAAYQWHGPLMFIPVIMMSAATPTLVQQWELGNSREFMRITGLLCVAMVIISLPPLFVAIMFKEQINLVYGPSYDGIGLMVVLLIVAAPLHGISKVATTSLQAMGRSWYLLVTNLLWSLTVVVIALSSIPALGGLGLCIALVAAYFIHASLNAIGLLKAFRYNTRLQL